MTTRFLICVVFAAFLGGCAKQEEVAHTVHCSVCNTTWTVKEKGMITNQIRLHLEECRRLQRFKESHELIKVEPKLDSLPDTPGGERTFPNFLPRPARKPILKRILR